MSLASRLDRLRGHEGSVAPGPVAHRLERLRRTKTGPADQPAQIHALADALGAECDTGGLLIRNHEYLLPAVDIRRQDLSRLPEACDWHAPDWVYIDTETTGLSSGVGNVAFMVGVARYSDENRLQVRQYVLASFAAETRMLRDLFGWVGSDAALVSYNGKCFDLPLLIGRLRMHRIDVDPGRLPHLDLMYSVRRAYRRYWPDCRLQTAEKRLLGLHRVDDLPGAQAPAAWQAWLRQGATLPLTRVTQHNYQDVVSLAMLHQRLLHDYAGSHRVDVDHAAIGRAWREVHQDRQARRIWESAGNLLDDNGSLQLARLYRQQRQWSLAEAIWRRLHARGSALAALELSKYYEHQKRDYDKAIDYARCCNGTERDERLARLQGKLGCNLQLPLAISQPA